MTEAPLRRTRRRTEKTRKRVSIVGVLGEILITAGVLVMLFLGWQLWLNDIIQGEVQQDVADEISQEWDKGESTLPPVAVDPGEPIVREEPGLNEVLANIYVPRFADDYKRTIYQGVDLYDVLDIGIGHYPDTQMPGEVGNFALAAHRTTWGKPFSEIARLEVGDKIYVETEDGWYVYVFRSLEYVEPTGVGVIDPVPQASGVEPTDRILTMTSCNPMFSAAERIIAYSVYDHWVPRQNGPPEEIADVVQAGS
jgi:sortase A